MFERDWLRDLALGLIAFALMLPLALLAVGLMAPSGNSDIKSYAQGHIDSSNDPAFQSWANQQAACAEAANGGASEADQRAQDDLCAQFRSAFAAEKMVWLSSRQIFISSLEFGALILSLGFTGWAAFAASNAAKAAEKAVEQNEATARIQLRAYINLDACDIWVHETRKEVIAGLIFKNAGSTPATSVSFWGGYIFHPADRDMLNLSEHYEEWTEDTVIGPGEEQPIFFHIDAGVFEDHKSAVLERREEFLLAGTLIYWDVFGKDHTVNFAQVLEHDGADLFEGIFVQWAQEAHVD